MALEKINKVPLFKAVGVVALLRNLFVLLFVISFLLNIYSVWQETGEIEGVIKDVGGQIFNPLYNLEQHTLKISEEGFTDFSEGILKGYWIFIKNIYLFLEPFIVSFLWFKFFVSIISFFMGDITPKFYVYTASFIAFTIIQWFYIILFTDLNMLTPFRALENVVGYLLKLVE